MSFGDVREFRRTEHSRRPRPPYQWDRSGSQVRNARNAFLVMTAFVVGGAILAEVLR